MAALHRKKVAILGIESSCDETSAAVVCSGERLLSNVVYSQIVTHQPFGGVVPELASREHLRAIVPVVRKALTDAGYDFRSIDAIAVTQGPGLAGALLVGITYAKALAFALQKPLIAVNHIEGHIHAVLLEQRQAGNMEIEFPLLALVVSGGHTHLYLVQEKMGAWTYRNIGRTLDDAAGEAFDKTAKLLGLGYPGGPMIDALAPFGDPRTVKFPPAQIKTKRGHAVSERFDFSFSGIKTAVLRYVELNAMAASIDARKHAMAEIAQPSIEQYREHCDTQTLDLIASFQYSVVRDLVNKTLVAAREHEVQTLFVTGGVAANRELRQTFEDETSLEGIALAFPSRSLSTDNAAMIAAAAYPRFLLGEFASPDFNAEASLPLR